VARVEGRFRTGTVSFSATLAGKAISLPPSCQAAVAHQLFGAACTFTPTIPGTYVFSAIYSGDSSAAGSTRTVSDQVTAPTTTRVSISPSRAQRGQKVTITATVRPIPDGGNVDFQLGSWPRDSSICSLVPVNASGQATCSFTPSRDDTDTFGATYSGDALYGGSHGSNNDRHEG
jgi:Bacterial Ig-like domain (group 3)